MDGQLMQVGGYLVAVLFLLGLLVVVFFGAWIAVSQLCQAATSFLRALASPITWTALAFVGIGVAALCMAPNTTGAVIANGLQVVFRLLGAMFHALAKAIVNRWL